MAEVGTWRLVHLSTNVTAPSSTLIQPGHKCVDVRTALLTPYNTSCGGLHHIHFCIFIVHHICQRTHDTTKGDLTLLYHITALWNVCIRQSEETRWTLNAGINALHHGLMLLMLHSRLMLLHLWMHSRLLLLMLLWWWYWSCWGLCLLLIKASGCCWCIGCGGWWDRSVHHGWRRNSPCLLDTGRRRLHGLHWRCGGLHHGRGRSWTRYLLIVQRHASHRSR
mmetsp:Transcript_3622/g.5274  ORF Transcript_3622/g.5274 Transcript_3622/m.5274 type:complete len:222 (+) Transcript_3622:2492-3157(+)